MTEAAERRVFATDEEWVDQEAVFEWRVRLAQPTPFPSGTCHSPLPFCGSLDSCLRGNDGRCDGLATPLTRCH
ncbi:MAG: hypothetical protein JWP89_1392 [Schlesneria sp.]|nr:hypothetical protein [Schlesneria sp.]